MTAAPDRSTHNPSVVPRPRSFRAALIRQVTLWHWVSSSLCLGGMLLFTVTGITLNHASQISATPRVTKLDFTAPPPVRALLISGPAEGRHPMPPVLAAWLRETVNAPSGAQAEWNTGEVYISLPRPGGDAWITLERATGQAHYEKTDRGWISYFNDLHKGRHTGAVWSWYIDLLAAACLVFSLSGLILLQTDAAKRPSTWPLIGFSVLSPVLLLIFFLHRQ